MNNIYCLNINTLRMDGVQKLNPALGHDKPDIVNI